ncbi:putative mitochondrial methyltransferase OMS1 precursor [Cladorrhinum sp. PSN332]|nr:putative mitochondrial methyltransferase OMS1 precursor [Cladorrhinum sp. PSN332]
MASRLILRTPIRPHFHNPPSSHTFTFSRNLNTSSRLQAKRRLQPITQSPTPNASSKPSPPRPAKTNPNSTPLTFNEIFSQRKLPLIGAGLIALMIGTYVSVVITSSLKTQTAPCAQHDHISAQKFDTRLDLPEKLGGITSLRRQLTSRARGHVLEIAIGTGRNLPYYDWAEVVSPSDQTEAERVSKVLNWPLRKYGSQVTDLEKSPGGLEGEVLSYTGVDISPDMLLLARDRVRLNIPGLNKLMRKKRIEPMPESKPSTVVSAVDDRVKLVLSDAEKLPFPSPPPSISTNEKYDTIVQTFGLCSVEDPKRLLKNMLSAVKPGTGKILLLEHGRGWWDWVNGLLDKWAKEHHEKYGCWWNRDIEGIVREVEREMGGKVEIKRLERPGWRQLGTAVVVELRVRGNGETKE